jgi:putative endonuclease
MILRRLTNWWSVWTRPRPLGERGERAAVKHLRRQGYEILARGFRRGELDIVAVQGRTIVFVEVKTRQSAVAGEPSAAVDLAKQARVSRGAQAFIKRHGLEGYAARFDVIAVTWPANQRRPAIEHVEDAFPAVGD